MNEAEAETQQEAPRPITVKSTRSVRVHAGPFEFKMKSRRLDRGEQLVDYGPTLEINGLVDGQSQEILKFDCFARGPHWHRCSPGKPDVITQLENQDAGQALHFAIDTLRSRFGSLIEEQGFAPLSSATEGPELSAALSAVKGAMSRLLLCDPDTL